jgi:hypothetical protein
MIQIYVKRIQIYVKRIDVSKKKCTRCLRAAQFNIMFVLPVGWKAAACVPLRPPENQALQLEGLVLR